MMNNTNNNISISSAFLRKLFDIIVFEEMPENVLQFVEKEENQECVKSLQLLTNDEIDRIILACHAEHISKASGISYETVTLGFFDKIEQDIDSSQLLEGKIQILYACSRIKLYFAEYNSMLKSLRNFLIDQTNRLVKNEIAAKIDDVSDNLYQSVTKEFALTIDREMCKAKTAVEQVSKVAQNVAQDAANSAKVAAKIAEKASTNAAEKAVDSAIKQVVSEQKIERRINDCVDSQMNRVTTKISETSVTILGIFSGIVLTVVAGLFYSASVLENINAVDFDRLLCAASLVGLVCIDLMAIMFLFVKQLSKREQKPGESILKSLPLFTIVLLINIVLIITMTRADIKQVSNSNSNASSASGKTDVNISAQVNISSNDSLKDSTADIKPGSDTTTDSGSISNQGTQSNGTDTSADIASGDSTGIDTSMVPNSDSSTTT